MARLPRLVLPGQPHLIIQRARAGESVFGSDDGRRDYLIALREALAETGAALHGYGLLAHEARLLVTPRRRTDLALLVQSVGRRHVRALNSRLARRGSPWEGRFRSAPLDAGSRFLDCLRFAEAEGEEPLESSRPHHIGARNDPLVEHHEVFWRLGNTPFEREAAYRRMTEHPLAEPLRAGIRATVMRGMPIGPDAFVRAVGAVTGRRTTPGIRGRPPQRAR